jgi:hypothetical protein
MTDTVKGIFGGIGSTLFGGGTPAPAAAVDKTAERAAALQRSAQIADQEESKQRAQLTLGARGRRGLLAFIPGELSNTLGG